MTDPKHLTRAGATLLMPSAILLLLIACDAVLLHSQRFSIGLVGALVLLGIGAALLAFLRRARTQADAPPPSSPDAASEQEQRAALAHLAGLAHIRELADGSLFDYASGVAITACTCGRHSPYHLVVSYGPECAVTLVSSSALAQYVAVQDGIATLLCGKGV